MQKYTALNRIWHGHIKCLVTDAANLKQRKLKHIGFWCTAALFITLRAMTDHSSSVLRNWRLLHVETLAEVDKLLAKISEFTNGGLAENVAECKLAMAAQHAALLTSFEAGLKQCDFDLKEAYEQKHKEAEVVQDEFWITSGQLAAMASNVSKRAGDSTDAIAFARSSVIAASPLLLAHAKPDHSSEFVAVRFPVDRLASQLETYTFRAGVEFSMACSGPGITKPFCVRQSETRRAITVKCFQAGGKPVQNLQDSDIAVRLVNLDVFETEIALQHKPSVCSAGTFKVYYTGTSRDFEIHLNVLGRFKSCRVRSGDWTAMHSCTVLGNQAIPSDELWLEDPRVRIHCQSWVSCWKVTESGTFMVAGTQDNSGVRSFGVKEYDAEGKYLRQIAESECEVMSVDVRGNTVAYGYLQEKSEGDLYVVICHDYDSSLFRQRLTFGTASQGNLHDLMISGDESAALATTFAGAYLLDLQNPSMTAVTYGRSDGSKFAQMASVSWTPMGNVVAETFDATRQYSEIGLWSFPEGRCLRTLAYLAVDNMFHSTRFRIVDNRLLALYRNHDDEECFWVYQ